MAFGAPLRRILRSGGFSIQVTPLHHPALACPLLYCFSVGTLPVVQLTRQPFTSSGKREISTSNHKRKLADSLRYSHEGGNPCLYVRNHYNAELRVVQEYSLSPGSAEEPPVGVLRRVWTRVSGQVKAFMAGVRSLYKDVKRVRELEKRKGKLVIRRAAPDGVWEETGEKRFLFSREEVQFILITKREMWRMLPTVLLFWIPFFGYAVPFIAFAYLEKMLSRHFWMPEQKKEFAKKSLLSRQEHLQGVAAQLSKSAPFELTRILIRIKKQVQEGGSIKWSRMNTQGISDMATSLKEKNLSKKYVRLLAPCWGVRGWLPRSPWLKLERQLHYLYTCDWLILCEGGAEAMSHEELEQTCIERGIFAGSPEEQTEALNGWVSISTSFKDCPEILLAHLPLLQFDITQEQEKI